MQNLIGIPAIEKILIRKVVHDLTEIVKSNETTFKFFGVKQNKKFLTSEALQKQKEIYNGLSRLNSNLQWLAFNNPRQLISEIREIDFGKGKIFNLDSFYDYSTIKLLIEAQLEFQRRNYIKDETYICKKLLVNNGLRWIMGKAEDTLRFLEEASNIDYKQYIKNSVFHVANYGVFISDNAVLLERRYLETVSTQKNEILIASF